MFFNWKLVLCGDQKNDPIKNLNKISETMSGLPSRTSPSFFFKHFLFKSLYQLICYHKLKRLPRRLFFITHGENLAPNFNLNRHRSRIIIIGREPHLLHSITRFRSSAVILPDLFSFYSAQRFQRLMGRLYLASHSTLFLDYRNTP